MSADEESQPLLAADGEAASGREAASGGRSTEDDNKVLHHHLFRAKLLSERLLAVMAQREQRLQEIKARVNALETGAVNQPLLDAENKLKEAHDRMKTVLVDLAKELEEAGINELSIDDQQLSLPDSSDQQDEVAFLYKHLLLTLGEWKAEQGRQAHQRAEDLKVQVERLRQQVNKERDQTEVLRLKKDTLEQIRAQKQEQLRALQERMEDENQN